MEMLCQDRWCHLQNCFTHSHQASQNKKSVLCAFSVEENDKNLSQICRSVAKYLLVGIFQKLKFHLQFKEKYVDLI